MSKLEERVLNVKNQVLEGKKLFQSIYNGEGCQSFKEIYENIKKNEITNVTLLNYNDSLKTEFSKTIIPANTKIWVLLSGSGRRGNYLSSTEDGASQNYPSTYKVSYGGDIQYGYITYQIGIKLSLIQSNISANYYDTNLLIYNAQTNDKLNELSSNRGINVEGFTKIFPAEGDKYIEVEIPFNIGKKKLSFTGYNKHMDNDPIFQDTIMGITVNNTRPKEMFIHDNQGNGGLGCGGMNFWTSESVVYSYGTGGPGFALLIW